MLYVIIIISKSKKIIVINRYIDTKLKNKFYTYVTPNCDSKVGLIFGINSLRDLNKY